MEKLNGFAAECYNKKTIAELVDAYFPGEPDESECSEWNISEQEWLDAVGEALAAKVRDFLKINRDNDEVIKRAMKWAGRDDIAIDEDGYMVAGRGVYRGAYNDEQLNGFAAKNIDLFV